MDLTIEHFQAIIYDFRSNSSVESHFPQLIPEFGGDAALEITIYPWLNKLIFRRTCLYNEIYEGLLSIDTVSCNFYLLREMIQVNRLVKYAKIHSSLGIGMNVIHSILNDYLCVKKLCMR